jgi:hypothetical protein
VEVGPLDTVILDSMAHIYAAAGRWSQAVAMAREIQGLKQRSQRALALEIQGCLRLGLVQEAASAARGLMPELRMEADGRPFETPEDFDVLWKRILEVSLEDPGHRTRATRARFLAALAERDATYREATLRELEELARDGSWVLPMILRDPNFYPLAREPRFLAVLETAGLEPLPPPPAS